MTPTAPVGVTTGIDTAGTITGQVLVLSMVNQLSRAHPGLVLDVPDVALLVPSPAGGSRLLDASRRLALAANPEIRLDGHVTDADTLMLGIGADAGRASIYAGGDRWTAITSAAPVPVGVDRSALLGASMATTLGAGWVFRTSLGWPAIAERAMSLWTLSQTTKPTGPAEISPVDIGAVWLIGAGAVGSSLAWWLHYLGVVGTWTVIDGDIADITNLNRCLGLFAPDTGWRGEQPGFKADAAAHLIPGAVSFPGWWDAWAETDPPAPDAIVPVANEYGVRPAIAAYSHPAVIQATTSPHWSAELHRHILGRDGCITCRLPEDAPRFECAIGGAPEAGHGRVDAALPFLSAGAGLLLASALLQLQLDQWPAHDRNHWRVWFEPTVTAVTRHRQLCAHGCSATRAAGVRRLLHGDTRWIGLDPDVAG